MRIELKSFCFLFLIVLLGLDCSSDIYKSSISLESEWKFKQGDDLTWSDPNWDDSEWHNILPTRRWDKQGFEDIHPYVWYRKSFILPKKWKANVNGEDLLQIFLNKIDDTDQTFLNGQLIGQNGELVSTPSTFQGDIDAYNYVRNYQISVNDKRIKWGEKNVIAIRVHNHLGVGGLYNKSQHVCVVTKDQLQIAIPGKTFPGKNAINLGGYWKFKFADHPSRKLPHYNDAQWDSITVGGQWTWHGYEDDGFAWYRKKFYLSSELKSNSSFKESIQLILGSIQDKGEVFINGNRIDRYQKKTAENEDYPIHWGFPLIYNFSYNSGIFKWDQMNTIAVRVYNENPHMTDLKGGGMRGRPYILKVTDFHDFAEISRPNTLPVPIEEGKMYKIPFDIKNSSQSKAIKTKVNLQIQDKKNHEVVFFDSKELLIHPKRQKRLAFTFCPEHASDYHINYELVNLQNQKSIQKKQLFGYSKQSISHKPVPATYKVKPKVASKYTPFLIHDQKIEGLLGQRMQSNVNSGIMQIDEQALLSGYYAGSATGSPIGEFVNKYIQAGTELMMSGDNKVLYEKMSRIIDILIASQHDDGYLGTYTFYNRWTDWDLWVHKHALIGLLAYYQATSYPDALDAARKLADLLIREFGDKSNQLDLISKGPHAGMATSSLLDPMVELYKFTGKKKYLNFCQYIMESIEKPHGPKILSTIENTGRVDQVGNAKGYEMISNFIGMLKLYQVKGEKRLFDVVQIAWKDIVENRLYITGSSTISEHFTANHVLPGEEDVEPCESCVSVFWLYFNRELFYLTGDPKYAHEIEKTVYNHLLAAQHPVTNAICYFTPLQGHKKYVKNDAICCNASLTRNIARLPKIIWTRSRENGLAILLYNAGSVKEVIQTESGKEVPIRITIQSDFPRSGEVVIQVTPEIPCKFELNLLVPAWCPNFKATLGGETFYGKTGAFLCLNRKWTPTDKIYILMDMNDRIIPGDVNYPNAFALAHGPQILAVDYKLNATFHLKPISKISQSELQLEAVPNLLPNGWKNQQAYTSDLIRSTTNRPVVFIPFADAGQTGGDYRIWLDSYYSFERDRE